MISTKRMITSVNIKNPCMYCEGEIELARVEIGLTTCLSCAKLTTKKVTDGSVRMERLHRISEKEPEVDDAEAVAKVLDE